MPFTFFFLFQLVLPSAPDTGLNTALLRTGNGYGHGFTTHYRHMLFDHCLTTHYAGLTIALPRPGHWFGFQRAPIYIVVSRSCISAKIGRRLSQIAEHSGHTMTSRPSFVIEPFCRRSNHPQLTASFSVLKLAYREIYSHRLYAALFFTAPYRVVKMPA